MAMEPSSLQQIVDASAAILARAEQQGRDLTASEAAQIDSNTARFHQLRRRGDIAEQTAALEDDDPPSAGRRTSPAGYPGSTLAAGADQDEGFARPIAGLPMFRRLFGAHAVAETGGCRDSGEFLRAVATGAADNRLRAAANEQSGTAGGFTVPMPLIADVFDMSLRQELVRPMARVYPMTSSTLSIAGLDTEDQSTRGTVAGLHMEMLGELQDGTDQTPKFRRVMLNAKTGRIYARASIELAEDSINFAHELIEGFSAAMAQGLDNQTYRGTGVGQMLGVLNAPGKIVVDKESGQAADTIVLQNVLKMYARMYPPSIMTSVWWAHPSCIPQLFQLHKLFTNVAGSENVGGALAPVFQQNADGSFSMLGRPLQVTHHCSPLGDVGDLAFLNWKGYGVGLRRQAAIEANRFSAWQQFGEDYRLAIRFDGLPLRSQPIVIPDNADTLSDFVLLAERGA
jgi:HK97 family phage major capsid protein